MPAETKTKTVLLADLVGSTAKVTRLETELGADYIHDAVKPIEQTIREHHGQVVKFTGDGYLAVFESATHALEAAEDIRNYFMRQRYTPTGLPTDGIRVVVHTADIVVEEDGDVVGDGVIVTARLEKNVPTNQIWVTAATREVASSSNFTFEEVGEILIRGRVRPVYVYALKDSQPNYIEANITLLITDLHQYVTVSESLSPSDLNDWLIVWADLHREAAKGLKGRVRQFIADMTLMTFDSADDAFHALLNLQALVKIQNAKYGTSQPHYAFKGAMATGDLILSPTGIVGALVNRTFDVLNLTPRERFCTNPATFQHLETYAAQFETAQLNEQTVYMVKQP